MLLILYINDLLDVLASILMWDIIIPALFFFDAVVSLVSRRMLYQPIYERLKANAIASRYHWMRRDVVCYILFWMEYGLFCVRFAEASIATVNPSRLAYDSWSSFQTIMHKRKETRTNIYQAMRPFIMGMFIATVIRASDCTKCTGYYHYVEVMLSVFSSIRVNPHQRVIDRVIRHIPRCLSNYIRQGGHEKKIHLYWKYRDRSHRQCYHKMRQRQSMNRIHKKTYLSTYALSEWLVTRSGQYHFYS